MFSLGFPVIHGFDRLCSQVSLCLAGVAPLLLLRFSFIPSKGHGDAGGACLPSSFFVFRHTVCLGSFNRFSDNSRLNLFISLFPNCWGHTSISVKISFQRKPIWSARGQNVSTPPPYWVLSQNYPTHWKCCIPHKSDSQDDSFPFISPFLVPLCIIYDWASSADSY